MFDMESYYQGKEGLNQGRRQSVEVEVEMHDACSWNLSLGSLEELSYPCKIFISTSNIIVLIGD